MPLAWNEIRQRAATFARNWSAESRERAEAQSFWNEFFDVFGIRRRTVASFEEPVRNLAGAYEFIDLFWKGRLIAEHKSRGGNLEKAHTQANDYIQSLHNEGRTEEAPRYIIASDFARIALHDLEPEEPSQPSVEFHLSDLPQHIRRFAFIAGYQSRRVEAEDPANFKATELLANLHDRLEDGGCFGHDLQRFMVRVLFCLFAEDSGIFEPETFTQFIRNRTREDGSDVGAQLNRMFEALNTPTEARQANVDEDLASLPYVNGELFAERLRFPDFNSAMRTALLQCCAFRWEKISPAVFGSLFQNIMDDRERRQIGAHYTSERDIMRLIRSLFLDDLRAEFDAIRRDRRALAQFQRKLGDLRLLDPACGCGNFLVIAYRELRRLEMDLFQARFGDEPAEGDIRANCLIGVHQFHGIEIEEWPVRIAEVALWLMDHQMNAEVFQRFGAHRASVPIASSPTIRQANALRVDWNEVLPADRCSFILGNPPFVGKKARSAEQLADMKCVLAGIKGGGVLDYVCCWYLRAQQYMGRHPVRAAFVSTNSITQGEQPGVLWSELLRRNGLAIHFAHRTFPWESEARGKAHVHVVIIGFGPGAPAVRRLWEQSGDGNHSACAEVSNINPYLVAAPNILLQTRERPISDVPEMIFGNMPNDDGNLILTDEERREIVAQDKRIAPYIRPLVSAKEYLHGIPRWCLWLENAPPELIRGSTELRTRLGKVRRFRVVSSRETTRELAKYPGMFGEIRQPRSRYVLVPRHSSEHRRYIPLSYFSPHHIVHDSCLFVPRATLFHLGVLHSAMHMAWVRQVCGRLESRYRYSVKLVYNNYPWPVAPVLTDAKRSSVEQAAQRVLDARAQFPDATLADLYDPVAMPPSLAKAHARLDKAVDACYRRQPFTSERQRLEYLFALYEERVAPLTAKSRRRRASGERD